MSSDPLRNFMTGEMKFWLICLICYTFIIITTCLLANRYNTVYNTENTYTQDCCPLNCKDSETCKGYCCDGSMTPHNCKSTCCNGE